MIKILKQINNKKNQKKNLNGLVHIQSTLNNTIITITNLKGDTLIWSSAGNVGFKGTRKSTLFAAQVVAEKIASKALNIGLKNIDILIKGQGLGREVIIRVFENFGFNVTSIQDKTPIPHNGCRPRKRRRV